MHLNKSYVFSAFYSRLHSDRENHNIEKHIRRQTFFVRINCKTWTSIKFGNQWSFYGCMGMVGFWCFYSNIELFVSWYYFSINNNAYVGTTYVYDTRWIQCCLWNFGGKKYRVRFGSRYKALLQSLYDFVNWSCAILSYCSVVIRESDNRNFYEHR